MQQKTAILRLIHVNLFRKKLRKHGCNRYKPSFQPLSLLKLTLIYNTNIMPSQKLLRSSDRWLAGVCGGLAEYIGIDAGIFRIIWLILTVFTAGFPGILFYIILWILMPSK